MKKKRIFRSYTVISLLEAFSPFVITVQAVVGEVDPACWCVDAILCGRCKNKTADHVEKDSSGITFEASHEARETDQEGRPRWKVGGWDGKRKVLNKNKIPDLKKMTGIDSDKTKFALLLFVVRLCRRRRPRSATALN